MKNGAAFGVGLLSGVVLVLVVEKLTDNNDNKTINGGSAKRKNYMVGTLPILMALSLAMIKKL